MSPNHHFHSNPHSPLRIPQDKLQQQNIYQNSSPTTSGVNSLDHFTLDHQPTDSLFFIPQRDRSQTQPHPHSHLPQQRMQNNNPMYFNGM